MTKENFELKSQTFEYDDGNFIYKVTYKRTRVTNRGVWYLFRRPTNTVDFPPYQKTLRKGVWVPILNNDEMDSFETFEDIVAALTKD